MLFACTYAAAGCIPSESRRNRGWVCRVPWPHATAKMWASLTYGRYIAIAATDMIEGETMTPAIIDAMAWHIEYHRAYPRMWWACGHNINTTPQQQHPGFRVSWPTSRRREKETMFGAIKNGCHNNTYLLKSIQIIHYYILAHLRLCRGFYHLPYKPPSTSDASTYASRAHVSSEHIFTHTWHTTVVVWFLPWHASRHEEPAMSE